MPVPVDLSKLSDVVKNDVVKKDVYDKLVSKVNAISLNNIDTNRFILKNECDYEKYYMKIKFNSDNDLPLNKQLKFHNMVITIRSVFEKDGKLYPQVFLDDTLYE